MFVKFVVLCAVVVAVSSNGLINTGVSSRSRVQDAHGNYAFEYGIASNGAKRSRSEVGSGIPIKTAYAVSDAHIAPIAPLGHAGVIGIGGLGCAGLGCGGCVGLGCGRLGLGAGLIGAPGLGLAGIGKLI